MSHKPLSELHEKMLRGVMASRAVAVRKARETGTKLVIWQDGKIAHVTPDEYERLHPDVKAPPHHGAMG